MTLAQPLPPLPAGWSEKNNGECRACHAAIRWAKNDESGKMSPFDIDGTSHFATCPDADRFRQKQVPGGSGASAAVAVIEAARTLVRIGVAGNLTQAMDALERTIADFDREMGVSR